MNTRCCLLQIWTKKKKHMEKHWKQRKLRYFDQVEPKWGLFCSMICRRPVGCDRYFIQSLFLNFCQDRWVQINMKAPSCSVSSCRTKWDPNQKDVWLSPPASGIVGFANVQVCALQKGTQASHESLVFFGGVMDSMIAWGVFAFLIFSCVCFSICWMRKEKTSRTIHCGPCFYVLSKQLHDSLAQMPSRQCLGHSPSYNWYCSSLMHVWSFLTPQLEQAESALLSFKTIRMSLISLMFLLFLSHKCLYI